MRPRFHEHEVSGGHVRLSEFWFALFMIGVITVSFIMGWIIGYGIGRVSGIEDTLRAVDRQKEREKWR